MISVHMIILLVQVTCKCAFRSVEVIACVHLVKPATVSEFRRATIIEGGR